MKRKLNWSILFALLFMLPQIINAQGIPVDTVSKISWPFNTGLEGQAATFSGTTKGCFNANWVGNGSNLAYKATSTTYGITYTLFQPNAQSTTVTSNDVVSFNLRPKSKLRFKPDSISFDCMRFGTDGGLIDVVWKSTDGTLTTIATGIKPARNNSNAGTHVKYDLSTLSISKSEGDCSLNIFIYSLGNTKTIGLANIIIHGAVSDTFLNIPTYKIATSVYPAAAGKISMIPYGNEFEMGTNITLNAATRNFGYQFKEWQDGNGNVLSTSQLLIFPLLKDTIIKAVYDVLTTYDYAVNIAGSQWGKVTLSPLPTNGKYEAGTTVVMAVSPNAVTKFSYWEDASTATSRTILMDGNKTFTATFDEMPFIVGWDFKATSPTTARSGDYYADVSNIGLLNMYNQDGTIVGWLGNGGAFSPTTPCAYLWTTGASFATNRRYWQATFSTVGYTNILVKSQMAGSYQHYLTQKIQASLDGISFTDLKSVDVSTSVWSDLNDTLPAVYEGKTKVYIRWIADATSTLVGNATDADGTAITNILVYADKALVNDTVAPTLVSTVPAEGVANASANGSIVLTFDEKMKAATGNCTLDATSLIPSFGSKTVSFAYNKLNYNKDYTFTVPAGALTDVAGNTFAGITIHFRTMSRPIPAAKLFDVVIAKDGSGDFTTIQAAINAAPQNRVLPYLIFIKNGTYFGHVDIPASKPFIHLIGQQRDSVIISGARLCGTSTTYPDSIVYSVAQGASVVVNSASCYFENITFENKFGYDNLSGPQALALYTINDKIVLNNCWLRSYQDTYLTSYGNLAYRHYIKNCRIEGAVDFIYGGGDIFFDRCTIYCNRSSGGYIVAPSHLPGTKWGYVFSNCTIDGPNSSYVTYLGRPWANSPKTSFFNTISKIGIYPVGWLDHMGALPSVFADYNTMDGNGNALDLSYRINKYWIMSGADTIWGTAKKSYTDTEAAQFTYENVTSGTDNWDPRVLTEITDAPVISLVGNIVSWNAVDYAICYVVLSNNKVVNFTTSNSFQVTANGTIKVLAASEYGALSALSNSVEYTGYTSVPKQEKTTKLKIRQTYNYVEVANLPDHATVRVYNFNGVLVLTKVNTSGSIQIPVNQNLIIQVKSQSEVEVFKILKR